MATKPIPEGYHTLTPYLIVDNATRAIEFYKRAFNAKELMRIDAPDGRVGHAELKIGDSTIMLSDECPSGEFRGPNTLGGTSVTLALYVKDVDARFQQAISAGAKEFKPVKDQFYGDRSGSLTDPFGHVWTLSTHKEDLSVEDMKKRAAELYLKEKAHA